MFRRILRQQRCLLTAGMIQMAEASRKLLMNLLFLECFRANVL